jgi:WD40 repeat protein
MLKYASPASTLIVGISVVLANQQMLGAGADKANAVDRFGDPLPAGTVARIGTVRFRPGGMISALAISPDGKRLASWSPSPSHVLCIWDTISGKALRRWNLTGTDLLALSFLPGAKSVAIIRSPLDDQVHIWDFESGQPPPIIPAGGARAFMAGEDPEDYPYAAAANSPDGKVIATSAHAAKGREYILQLCDLTSGTTVGQLNVLREIGAYGKPLLC